MKKYFIPLCLMIIGNTFALKWEAKVNAGIEDNPGKLYQEMNIFEDPEPFYSLDGKVVLKGKLGSFKFTQLIKAHFTGFTDSEVNEVDHYNLHGVSQITKKIAKKWRWTSRLHYGLFKEIDEFASKNYIVKLKGSDSFKYIGKKDDVILDFSFAYNDYLNLIESFTNSMDVVVDPFENDEVEIHIDATWKHYYGKGFKEYLELKLTNEFTQAIERVARFSNGSEDPDSEKAQSYMAKLLMGYNAPLGNCTFEPNVYIGQNLDLIHQAEDYLLYGGALSVGYKATKELKISADVSLSKEDYKLWLSDITDPSSATLNVANFSAGLAISYKIDKNFNLGLDFVRSVKRSNDVAKLTRLENSKASISLAAKF